MKNVNISLPPEKLKQFCDENDDWVLALKNNMKPQELRKLFNSHVSSAYYNESILCAIAEHSNTPNDILFKLSQLGDINIMRHIATNPKITEDVFCNLLKTDDYVVLEHLVYNSAMTINNLKLILKNSLDNDLKETVIGLLNDK